MADDISNVLILNKKSIQSQENQIFQQELDKFRPHQNRLLQMAHKQGALMKELTLAYGDLLQDKRIRAEQNKYESLSRQRNGVLTRFKKTYQAFLDITAGLGKATEFYREMKDTVESLEKNVETFVTNRRTEGAQLLAKIESDKPSDTDRRLLELMDKWSVNQPAAQKPSPANTPSRPPTLQAGPKAGTPQPPTHASMQPPHLQASSPPPTPRYTPHASVGTGYYSSQTPPPPPPPPLPPSAPPTTTTFSGYNPYPQPPQPNGQYGTGVRRESIPYSQMANSMQSRPSAYPFAGAPPRRDSHPFSGMPSSPPASQAHMQYHPSQYQPGQYQQNYPPQQPYNPGAYSVPPPPPGPPPQGQVNVNGRPNYTPQGYPPQPPPTPGQPNQYYTQQQPNQSLPQQQSADVWQGLSNWK